MPDEQKPSWWKSLPGILTAATGFVAALSGLVAGLNQLGVFRREPPATQVVGMVAAPRESTSQGPATPATGGSASSTAPEPASGRLTAPAPGAPSATSPRPASPSSATRPGAPTPPAAPSPAPRAGNPDDTATAGPSWLPKGTVLELAVPSRTCAPATGQERFTARLVAPVKVAGATALPASTTAVLHLRRGGSSSAPEMRLDSLVRPDVGLAVPASDVRVRRGVAGAACLRAGTRLSVTLGAPVPLRPR